MDSSLLHHGFGIKGQEVLKSEYKEGAVIVHIQTKKRYLRCSECRSTNVIKRGTTERVFRAAPIGLKPVYLKVTVHRLECKDCGCLRQERLLYAEQKKAIPLD